MRTVRLYRIPEPEISEVNKDGAKSDLSRIALEDLRAHYSESGQSGADLRVQNVMNRVSKDRVGSVRSDAISLYASFDYEFEEQISGITAGDRSYQTVRVPFSTQMRVKLSTGLMSFVDIPWPPLADRLADLVTFALTGNGSTAGRMEFDRASFEALLYWVESGDLHESPGRATRAIFEGVSRESEYLDELNIKAGSLSTLLLFKEAVSKASKWRVLTFTSPRLEGFERTLTVRVSSEGSLLIYTREVTAEEIYSLLDGIEIALGET